MRKKPTSSKPSIKEAVKRLRSGVIFFPGVEVMTLDKDTFDPAAVHSLIARATGEN